MGNVVKTLKMEVVEDIQQENTEENVIIFPDDPKHYLFNIKDFNFDTTLGRTNNSTVSKCLHTPSERWMAVKTTLTQNVDREVQNLRLISSCKNIVSFYGICRDQLNAFICMELMDFPLKDYYNFTHLETGEFPEDVFGGVAVAITDALIYCNSRNIFHRDIKPLNIMLKYNGEIKLSDFGSKKLVKGSLPESNHETIVYWPPERFRLNNLKYDERADIWSLGITLFESMLGELPYLENGHFVSGIEPFVFAQHAILQMKVDDYRRYLGVKSGVHGNSNTIYSDFIEICLKEIEQRATLNDLKNSKIYQEYENKKLELPEKQVLVY